MFDNYNHPDDFYFSIEPGIYRVTIAVGWMGSCRDGDTEYVQANGVLLRAFNCSACACKDVREYAANVMVKGNNVRRSLVHYRVILRSFRPPLAVDPARGQLLR